MRQKGQAIVLMAMIMVALFGMGALAFDAGYAMSDRRNLQAVADSAALAGSRSYPSGANTAHYVAMQYLGYQLGFPIPPACRPADCDSGPYNTGGYSVRLQDTGSNVLDVSLQHTQPGIFSRAIGIGSSQVGTGARGTPPSPGITASTYAVAALQGDALINGGGAAYQTVGGPVYARGSFGANNGPHSTGIPAVQTNYDGTACPGSPPNHVDNGSTGNGLNYTWIGGSGNQVPNVAPPYYYDYQAPAVPVTAPTFPSGSGLAQIAGVWQPGVYDGWFPSGGTMAGGVYKVINVPGTISLGSISNAVNPGPGQVNPTGAVAIVLDASDTGGLDISQAQLNGLDDLAGAGGAGTRDPMGTHNFVIWGGNGIYGFKGGMAIGPGASTNMTGIIYLPQTAYVSNGNSSPVFNGSFVVATMTVNGGGNGRQVFNWVCGLGAVNPAGYVGGLVR